MGIDEQTTSSLISGGGSDPISIAPTRVGNGDSSLISSTKGASDVSSTPPSSATTAVKAAWPCANCRSIVSCQEYRCRVCGGIQVKIPPSPPSCYSKITATTASTARLSSSDELSSHHRKKQRQFWMLERLMTSPTNGTTSTSPSQQQTQTETTPTPSPTPTPTHAIQSPTQSQSLPEARTMSMDGEDDDVFSDPKVSTDDDDLIRFDLDYHLSRPLRNVSFHSQDDTTIAVDNDFEMQRPNDPVANVLLDHEDDIIADNCTNTNGTAPITMTGNLEYYSGNENKWVHHHHRYGRPHAGSSFVLLYKDRYPVSLLGGHIINEDEKGENDDDTLSNNNNISHGNNNSKSNLVLLNQNMNNDRSSILSDSPLLMAPSPPPSSFSKASGWKRKDKATSTTIIATSASAPGIATPLVKKTKL